MRAITSLSVCCVHAHHHARNLSRPDLKNKTEIKVVSPAHLYIPSNFKVYFDLYLKDWLHYKTIFFAMK